MALRRAADKAYMLIEPIYHEAFRSFFTLKKPTVFSTVGSTDDRRHAAARTCHGEGVGQTLSPVETWH